MATKKRKSDIDPNELERNFNIVYEPDEPDINSGKYFLHNKYWVERILGMSVILNVMSIALLFIGMTLFLMKPTPSVYGSTEYGSLYELKGLNRAEALAIVNQPKNTNVGETVTPVAPATNKEPPINSNPAPATEPSASTNNSETKK